MTSNRFVARSRPTAVALIASAALLAGCGGGTTARDFLGFDSSVPDEFAVAPTAPLAMPASLEVLPPPQPGAPRPQETPLHAQAAGILFNNGQPVALDGPTSAGGSAILARAGAVPMSQADRYAVDVETTATIRDDRRMFDSVLGTAPVTGTVIDPAAEAERIRTAQATGRPITAGDTEIIEPRRLGWLEALFGW